MEGGLKGGGNEERIMQIRKTYKSLDAPVTPWAHSAQIWICKCVSGIFCIQILPGWLLRVVLLFATFLGLSAVEAKLSVLN